MDGWTMRISLARARRRCCSSTIRTDHLKLNAVLTRVAATPIAWTS
jgi:hypothetical protein